MCDVIVVNRGEKDLDTPRKVQEYFGFPLKEDWCYDDVDVDLDACLCQIDIEVMLRENNIPFKYEAQSLWYHVGGDLDSLVFD